MGLGPLAMAMVSAECGRSRLASFIINAQAPDEGNMHTMLHFATPVAEGKISASALRRQNPLLLRDDRAGGRGLRSDANQNRMRKSSGDNWVINGHKWFISGAHGAKFAIVIAKTDPDADPPQARNSAFIVDLPNPGFQIVRDIDTMAGKGNHCEIMSRECASCPPMRCSAGAARGTRSGRCGSVPRASRIACDGSAMRRSRSR